MGTQLQLAGMPVGGCYELWNLSRPEVVTNIHRSYWEVGARCLNTNTFQANPQALARHGMSERLEEICEAGLRLAQSVVGEDGFVVASIGPMDISEETAALDRTLQAFASADALLLETWTEGFEVAAQRALSPVCNPNAIPVLISVTYASGLDSVTMPPASLTPGQVAERVSNLGVAGLGVNCGKDLGKEQILAVLAGYREVANVPLFVRPNAGTPRKQNGRWVYPVSPSEMAAWVPELIQAGVTMIGGCCGTTPGHIAAMRDVLH